MAAWPSSDGQPLASPAYTFVGMNRTAPAFAVVVVLLIGCQVVMPSRSVSPAAERSFQQASNLVDPEIGVPYPHIVNAHCGLGGVWIDSAPWVPAHFPIEDGWAPIAHHDRHPDFDHFNFDHGSLVLVDRDTAIYTSSGGTEVELRPYREGIDPEGPGCF